MANRNDKINESWSQRLATYGQEPSDINDFVVRRRLQTGQPQDGGVAPNTDGRRIVEQLGVCYLDNRHRNMRNLDDSSAAMRDASAYMDQYDYNPEMTIPEFPSPYTRLDHKKRPGN